MELLSKSVIKDEYIIKPKTPKPIKKVVEFFIGEVKSRNVVIQDGEIFEYKWITSEEGLAILTYDSSKRLLKSANEITGNYLQKNK